MGDTGPCGPCSEIHFDQGADLTCRGRPDLRPRRATATATWRSGTWSSCSSSRRRRHADAAARAQRSTPARVWSGITAVLQGVRATSTPTSSGRSSSGRGARRRAATARARTDVSLRVIADHARASAFLVADGVLPANEGRGYVLRRDPAARLRHGRRSASTSRSCTRSSPAVVEMMGEAYPELVGAEHARSSRSRAARRSGSARRSRPASRCSSEVEREAPAGPPRSLPGAESSGSTTPSASRSTSLQDIAAERGVTLDQAGFERASWPSSATRARRSWKGAGEGRGEGRVARARRGSYRTAFEGCDATRARRREVVALLVGRRRSRSRRCEGRDGRGAARRDAVLRRGGRPGRRHR